MGWGQAIILGIVQGLTEFLPISSSGHVRIVSALLGWQDPGAAFTAVTQLGTETAVLVYFRKDIWEIVTTWLESLRRPALRREPAARIGWYVILGTLPIGLIGLALQSTIETTFRDLRVIALTLIVFGVILGIADKLGRGERTMQDLNLPHAVTIGLAQCLALIPGVSRSGGTISAGLLLGYSREAAARYAFLLAVPAVLASGLLELTKIGGSNTPAWGPTIAATLIAFVIGYAVIAWLLRYLSHGSFRPFVIYRIVLGLALIALVTVGALPALP
ncbi:undecaprenyl-diphosphate phosphatase [Kineosporia mesophila]|uniref:undecaprenyl-diphosphate phosphatase n=1 Tax=Kineosporia mesophila TaxID=566012 RepID=UPI0031E4E979